LTAELFILIIVKIDIIKIGDMMKNLMVDLLVLLAVTACAGKSHPSIQGQWSLVSYGSPFNRTPAAPNVDTFIEFDAEGRMTGNVGCNGFGGGYTLDDDTLEFDPVEATAMFCEGPVGEQELGTFRVLQGVTTYVLDGDKLTISSTDESSSIVLERK